MVSDPTKENGGEKRNIRLDIAYDGTDYHGWQRQKEDQTIQAHVEKQIEIITNSPATLTASGRTDAGVHALNQTCNFFTRSNLSPKSLKQGLNALLPADIFIKKAVDVPLEFHSRYSAKSKTYEYRIFNHTEPNIFLRKYQWHIPDPLDVSGMNACMDLLVGEHDFSSFQSAGSDIHSPVRHMIHTEILTPRKEMIYLRFQATGFLRHMVRNMVGTLIDVGRGKKVPKDFLEILHARDRRIAGLNAPPHGLYLVRVHY